jgi:hypothetical protein
MSEFIGKYENLRKESVEYITNFLKNNGGRFDYVTQEEIESDDFIEMHHELPQATYVGKMEYTDYYAITSIRFEKDNIWLNGVNVGNDNDDYTFGAYEVDVACLCDCADLLIIKEK